MAAAVVINQDIVLTSPVPDHPDAFLVSSIALNFGFLLVFSILLVERFVFTVGLCIFEF